MGCTSSSLSFRETYLSLQKRWHLCPDERGEAEENRVNERTHLFQSCATERARGASKKLPFRGQVLFKCTPLVVEQVRLLTPPFAEQGKKTTLHPYSTVLFQRLLGAVSAEHAYQVQQKEVVSPRVTHFLARWDYRLWMITCCEFFHVLSVFQSAKALPKEVQRFMKALPQELKGLTQPASQAESGEDIQSTLALLARVWKEGSATVLTAGMLSPKLVAALRLQVPRIFTASELQGDKDDALVAKTLVHLACGYQVRLVKVMNLHGSNPLYCPGVKDGSTALSFLAFVEWAAMQCALSACGAEEDPASYGVVQMEYSEKVLKHQNESMELWRKRLHRLEVVEEQLAELEPLGDRSQAYVDLQTERQEILNATKELCATWCGERDALNAAAVAERCFETLEIRKTLLDSSVHEVLSLKAFESAVKDSASGTIDTPDAFRQYLKAYLALHDLYRDVLLHQLTASQKDGTYEISCMPGSVNFEAFRAALWSAQLRHDIELDPLMAAVGGGKGILSADEVAHVFKQLFNMEVSESADGTSKVVNFDAICTTGAGDLVPTGETLAQQRSIEQLGEVIGLTDAKSQARFIAAFLNQVFTLSENRLSSFGVTLAAEALETVAELPRYTDYSAGVGVMAFRFTILTPPRWSAFATKESSSPDIFVKWLLKIRSEAADRLSLGDHSGCDFFVRTLFAIAAAQRAFEDTAPGKAQGPATAAGSAGGEAGSGGARKDHEATESHFVRAVAAMCKYLDCSAEVLLHSWAALLSHGDGGGSASDNEGAGFTVERAFAVCHDALRGIDGRTTTASESADFPSGELTVSIRHVLFVVVSNYTRVHCAEYWRANNIFSCFDESALGVNGEPVPKWSAENDVLALSNAMPLRRMNSTYREFAELTNSCARDAESSGEAGGAFQDQFLHVFYEQYKPFFEKLELSEAAVTEMSRRAWEHITHDPKRVGTPEVFTRNDYNGFLQFVLGFVMMQKAYDCTVRDATTNAAPATGAGEEGETFLSERNLRRILACFTRLTDGGAVNVPPAEEAQAWLQSRGINSGYEGFLSLDDAFLWYSAHRVESYALESLFNWWREKFAVRIPFTVSAAHRSVRLSATRDILRIKQHRESLPDDEAVELAEDEDGYLPVDIMTYVMNRRVRLEEVTLRVFHMFEQENASEGALPGTDGAEPAAADRSVKAPAWLRSCVRGLNAVVHRSDLESREVHHSDFRFLLQYVHHFVSAYVGLYYSITVLEVSAQSTLSTADQDQITGVSDEDRARLVDIFRHSVLPLLLPSGTAPAEMTSVLDTLLSKAWEEKRTKSVVADATCEEVAHGIAALFVRHSHEISSRARHSYLDNREAQALHEAFTTERAFLGALGGYGASAKLKYWERLRLLLPFGPSLRHRERRRELYLWMDRRQRGYLTMSDLAGGMMDLVQLQSFRADFTPALLRAFTATKEMSGEHQKVVYLTQKSEEQVLLPAELDAFLTYLYRYLELYFMFDVLTCGGHVHPVTLHVVQKVQSYGANDDDDDAAAGGARASTSPATTLGTAAPSSVVDSTTTPGASTTSAPARSGAIALLEAAKKPYQITLEAGPMKKEITVAQFRMGRQLLRKWGAHVKNPDEVFYTVNNRRRDVESMSFIGFAIWASQHDLHPEGYGYGYDDAVDAIATMEEEYASL